MNFKIQTLFYLFLMAVALNIEAQEISSVSTNGYETEDELFSEPYIDRNEWRDTPIGHHYVHGGFEGTNTKFSFYFPVKEKYDGRFFQYITPIPDNENLSQNAPTRESDKISFAIESGAYFIETNGGGPLDFSNPMANDATIGAYRANAACAQFSRVVAKQLYGGERPYGYAFGGSGGSLRTIGSIENTSGVWDGVVPYVMPTPMSIPNSFTAGMLAGRVLKNKTSEIVDALAAGSEKSVYDVLETAEEIAAYYEITAFGFPPGAWRTGQSEGAGLGAFALILPTILQMDPGYFTDFWTKPGYAGYNPSESLKKDRVQLVSKVEKIISAEEAMEMGLEYDPFGEESRGLAANAWKGLIQKDASGNIPVAIQLKAVPENKTGSYDLIVNSGVVKGQKLNIQWIDGNIVILTVGNNEAAKKLKVGDELKFDNSNLLAVSYYHRHQVPGDEYYVYDQYKDANGKPIYPQRPMLLAPMFAAAASGSVPSGKFEGRMIVVQNMNDGGALPWHADWMKSRVKENLGDELDDHFCIMFTEHANHGDYPSQPDPTHDIVYLGVLHQALRDLSAWVEDGIKPMGTNYEVENGQVILPEKANKRGGIQPVIKVKANGKERTEIKAGETVTLEAIIEVPKNAGKVVLAEWNFEGGKEFVAVDNIVRYYTNSSGTKAKVRTTYTYKSPGTYFPTLQGGSERSGNLETPFAVIKNLGSARVIVK
ncbi:hypothetical protein [uncultured Draconibacterium sp.]|uniref:hypothetical protein n=1 Tax=uncultured Draconibacterium sp. TaxID=1573823 RepID=UPI0025E995E8|nr:hypothetical protein [uncultured Draconibacterium sp.]